MHYPTVYILQPACMYICTCEYVMLSEYALHTHKLYHTSLLDPNKEILPQQVTSQREDRMDLDMETRASQYHQKLMLIKHLLIQD